MRCFKFLRFYLGAFLGLALLALLTSGLWASTSMQDFESFKMEYFPDSKAPLPPSTQVLMEFHELTDIQKVFYLQNYFKSLSAPEIERTLLLRADNELFQDVLHAYPLTVKRHLPHHQVYEILVPRTFEENDFFKRIHHDFPRVLLEKNPRLRLDIPDAGPQGAKDHLKELNWSDARLQISTTLPPMQRKVLVCVLDSGVGPHEDLPRQRLYQKDEMGHGTHVAGIIGAIRQNDIGIDGLTNQPELRSYKILDSQGTGNLMDLVAGLDQGFREGCDIANISLGTYEYSRILYEVLTDLSKKGLIMVAAAGNDATNRPVLPASHPMVIGVGSYASKKQLSAFSNYGKKNMQVSLPGENILSTHLNDRLKRLSGTSMAAPMFTGILAEILTGVSNQPPVRIILETLAWHDDEIKKRNKVTHAPFDFNLFYPKLQYYIKRGPKTP